MRMLFLGDIVGSCGRDAVVATVPKLRRELALDYVVANGENIAGGRGITPATADDLFFEAYVNGSGRWACCCTDGPFDSVSDSAGLWSSGSAAPSAGTRTSLTLDAYGDLQPVIDHYRTLLGDIAADRIVGDVWRELQAAGVPIGTAGARRPALAGT